MSKAIPHHGRRGVMISPSWRAVKYPYQWWHQKGVLVETQQPYPFAKHWRILTEKVLCLQWANSKLVPCSHHLMGYGCRMVLELPIERLDQEKRREKLP